MHSTKVEIVVNLSVKSVIVVINLELFFETSKLLRDSKLKVLGKMSEISTFCFVCENFQIFKALVDFWHSLTFYHHQNAFHASILSDVIIH